MIQEATPLDPVEREDEKDDVTIQTWSSGLTAKGSNRDPTRRPRMVVKKNKFRSQNPGTDGNTETIMRKTMQVEEAASLLKQRFPMSTVHLLRSLQEVQLSPLRSKQVAHDFLLNILSNNNHLEANQQQDLMILFHDTQSLTNLVVLLDESSPPVFVEQKCSWLCFCWQSSSFWNNKVRNL